MLKSLVPALLIAGAAPLAALALRAARSPIPAWLDMLSPLTAIPVISGTGMTGPQSPVTPLEIQLIVLTAIVAAALWLIAALRSNLGNPPEPC